MPSIKRMSRHLPSSKVLQKFNWHPGHMYAGMQAMLGKLNTVDCVIEVHDARIPLIGRNQEFRKHLGVIKPHLLVLNKTDLADLSRWEHIKLKLNENGDKEVLLTDLTGSQFSHGNRGYDKLLNRVVTMINNSNRYNRELSPEFKVMIVGIPNVGKSTLINRLRQYHLGLAGEATRTGSQAGVTRCVEEKVRICSRPLVYTLDTPGVLQPSVTKNHDTAMKLALCSAINDKVISSIDLAGYLLDYLNKSENYSYMASMNINDKAFDTHDLYLKVIKSRIEKSMNYKNDEEQICWQLIKLFRRGMFGKVLFE